MSQNIPREDSNKVDRPQEQNSSEAESGSTDHPTSATTAIQFNQEEQLFHKHLTLGIEEKLQRNRMIKDIKLTIRQPADKLSLSAWERKSGVHFPSDLKDYYMSTNGFKLTWSLEHAGDNLKIGEMSINPISHLILLESPTPNDTAVGHDKYGMSRPASVNVSSKGQEDSRKLGVTSASKLIGGGSKQLSSTSTMSSKYPTASASKSASTSNGSINGSSSTVDNSRKHLAHNDGGQEFQMYYQELRQTMQANDQVKSQDFGGLVLLPNDKAFILDSNQYGWVCLIYPHASNQLDQKTAGTSSSRKPDLSSISDSNKNSNKSHRAPSSDSSTSVKDGLPSLSSSIIVSEPAVEIWFLDQSFQWHYLAPTFTHYYRMMLFHLGLPQWQYRFTPFGLSSWAEQMFWLVAPHLLTPPKISKFPSMYHAGGLWSTEIPLEASSVNPTLNILTNQIFRRKKKEKPQ